MLVLVYISVFFRCMQVRYKLQKHSCICKKPAVCGDTFHIQHSASRLVNKFIFRVKHIVHFVDNVCYMLESDFTVRPSGKF